jgi:uncharacterized protein
MSRENVEVVQAAYRAINDADEEAFVRLAASDFELESHLLLDQGTFHGHEGARAYAEALREAWGETLRSYPEDLTEHGDRVVVMALTSAKGTTSGAATEARVAHVWTIRGGKIARLQTFRNPDEALEAVGLRE